MKKILLISFLTLSISLAALSQGSADISKAKDLTFFGIDYTQCYFVPSEAFYDADDVKVKIDAWNRLFKSEYEKYLVKTIKSKNITFSDEMIKEVNSQIDPQSRISDDESLYNHLNTDKVTEIISNYQIPGELSGIGFVFIAECYSKSEVKGAYYVTFFEITTKKVLVTERMTGKASGFGLRNYWANSYYVILKHLGKKYQ